MDDRDERQLERLMEAELGRLSDLPAPRTLVHRVMLAVHEQEQRSAWQRVWARWPRAVRWAVFGGLLAVATGLVQFSLGLLPEVHWGELWRRAIAGGKALEPEWEMLKTLGGAGLTVFKAGGRQWMLVGAGVVVAVYVTCVGLGTACCRLVLRRA